MSKGGGGVIEGQNLQILLVIFYSYFFLVCLSEEYILKTDFYEK